MGVISKFLGTIYYDKLVANSGATAIAGSQIDPALTQRLKITLTSVQILALNTTPITLIAAPGANQYIDIDDIVGLLNFNSIAYTGANALEIRYQNASGVKATADFPSAWLDSGSTRADKVTPVTVAAVLVNQPLVASVPVANPGAGNSTVTFDINYRVVTLP